jgi:hypothetical protein
MSLRCLYKAVDSGDTTAAANLFSRKIETWIEDLHLYAKKALGINFTQIQKKAAELIKLDGEAQVQKCRLQSCFEKDGDGNCSQRSPEGTICFKVY